MILDILTVFFLVAGLLLLIRLIRQRRRGLAKIIIEERVRELEPRAVGASSFGRRGSCYEEFGRIFQIRLEIISSLKMAFNKRSPTCGWTKRGRGNTQTRMTLIFSQSISEIEALISNNVQNNIDDRLIPK